MESAAALRNGEAGLDESEHIALTTHVIGQIAGITAAAGYVVYIGHVSTREARNEPLAGWIVWTLVGSLLFRSYLKVGAEDGYDSRWVLLVYALGPPLVLVALMLKRGFTPVTFSRLDTAFLVSSALSGVYLWRYDEGVLPLHVNMIVDVCGGYLIGVRTWRSPFSESRAAWALFSLGSGLTLFAVQRWNYLTARAGGCLTQQENA
jgi:hypothetical protein